MRSRLTAPSRSCGWLTRPRGPSETPPRRSDLVWYSVKEAMETLNRLPDREAGWLYAMRSAWPAFAHDHEDKLVQWEAMLERMKIGEIPKETPPAFVPPSPKAISRMERVLEWHRYLHGDRKSRDWKIVCLLGMGCKAGYVAKVAKCSKRSVYDRRELQTIYMAKGLAEAYGSEIFPL